MIQFSACHFGTNTTVITADSLCGTGTIQALISNYLKLLASTNPSSSEMLYSQSSQEFIEKQFTSEEIAKSASVLSHLKAYELNGIVWLTADYGMTFGDAILDDGKRWSTYSLSFVKELGRWRLRAGMIEMPFWDLLTIHLAHSGYDIFQEVSESAQLPVTPTVMDHP